jgi:hypothetical protein
MNTRRRKGFKAIAVFLAFAMAQISLQFSFAAPRAASFPTLPPQGLLAKVTTADGSSILINGISSPSGSSLATNAIVEAPAGIGATVDLGILGSIDLHPGAKIKLEFECPPEKQNDPDPDECKVKVTVLAGCIVSHYKKGTRHQVDTENQPNVAESDKEKEKKGGGVITYCKDAALAGLAAGTPWPGLLLLLGSALIIPPALIIIFDEPPVVSETAPAL